MKLGIYFDTGLNGLAPGDAYSIGWEQPFFPQTGDFICNPVRFFSASMKENFKNLQAVDYLPKEYFDGTNEGYKEQSLYEYFSDSNIDRYVVKETEWMYDEKNNMDYPVLYIVPA
jgi:hypothetical protein